MDSLRSYQDSLFSGISCDFTVLVEKDNFDRGVTEAGKNKPCVRLLEKRHVVCASKSFVFYRKSVFMRVRTPIMPGGGVMQLASQPVI